MRIRRLLLMLVPSLMGVFRLLPVYAVEADEAMASGANAAAFPHLARYLLEPLAQVGLVLAVAMGLIHMLKSRGKGTHGE